MSRHVAKNMGTGFYLDFPDANKYIILTAGHNLIGKDRTRATNLRLFESNRQSTPISDNQFFINEDYEHWPNDSNKANDWGAILLPKPLSRERLGFGFNLLFGTDLKGVDRNESLLDTVVASSELYICGYTDSSKDYLVMSSGKATVRSLDQVSYGFTTQPGLSGSPIFATYKGYETVVAIQ
jgi:V8-like Glu-specific endopeptidase